MISPASASSARAPRLSGAESTSIGGLNARSSRRTGFGVAKAPAETKRGIKRAAENHMMKRYCEVVSDEGWAQLLRGDGANWPTEEHFYTCSDPMRRGQHSPGGRRIYHVAVLECDECNHLLWYGTAFGQDSPLTPSSVGSRLDMLWSSAKVGALLRIGNEYRLMIWRAIHVSISITHRTRKHFG
jgi:hypothetical protein